MAQDAAHSVASAHPPVGEVQPQLSSSENRARHNSAQASGAEKPVQEPAAAESPAAGPSEDLGQRGDAGLTAGVEEQRAADTVTGAASHHAEGEPEGDSPAQRMLGGGAAEDTPSAEAMAPSAVMESVVHPGNATSAESVSGQAKEAQAEIPEPSDAEGGRSGPDRDEAHALAAAAEQAPEPGPPQLGAEENGNIAHKLPQAESGEEEQNSKPDVPAGGAPIAAEEQLPAAALPVAAVATAAKQSELPAAQPAAPADEEPAPVSAADEELTPAAALPAAAAVKEPIPATEEPAANETEALKDRGTATMQAESTQQLPSEPSRPVVLAANPAPNSRATPVANGTASPTVEGKGTHGTCQQSAGGTSQPKSSGTAAAGPSMPGDAPAAGGSLPVTEVKVQPPPALEAARTDRAAGVGAQQDSAAPTARPVGAATMSPVSVSNPLSGGGNTAAPAVSQGPTSKNTGVSSGTSRGASSRPMVTATASGTKDATVHRREAGLMPAKTLSPSGLLSPKASAKAKAALSPKPADGQLKRNTVEFNPLG